MISNKIEPKYNLKSNSRIGLISLATDYTIEKDFQKIKTTYLFNNYGPVYRGMRSVLGSMNNIKTNIILNAGMDRVKAAKTRYDFYEKITKKNLDADTAYIVDNKGHLINLKRKCKNLFVTIQNFNRCD